MGNQLRGAGLDDKHIRLLMELAGQWPPVLVSVEDHRVIDGAHRVVAAQRLGIRALPVRWFRGTPDEAYVEAVRRNVKHGLPLTSADRMRAVNQILEDHPDWSDRRISDICAVAAKTVARLRESRRPTIRTFESRVGKDGKRRPVNPALARERILRLLESDPGRSLRSVATSVGASPETVRSVRNSMRRLSAESPPDRVGNAEVTSPALAAALAFHSRQSKPSPWGMDLAFTSRADGKEFASWFQATAVHDDWLDYVGSVPLGRVYEIADEARYRAEFWAQFARALETRVQRSPLRV
jgi:hypothetical protein